MLQEGPKLSEHQDPGAVSGSDWSRNCQEGPGEPEDITTADERGSPCSQTSGLLQAREGLTQTTSSQRIQNRSLVGTTWQSFLRI